MTKILIVDDDDELAAMLSIALKSDGHVVDNVQDGQDGLHMMKFGVYDLILLDVNMPGMNGFEVCKSYRDNGGHSRILMLTSETDPSQKTRGLDCGADDYLSKPFNLDELSARIRALMRRGRDVVADTLSAGDLQLDVRTRKVTKAGKSLQLTPKELALLEFFMRHPDQVFSAEAILDRVWASDREASVATVRVALKRLRDKLGATEAEVPIKNVFGAGYRLDTNPS